MGDAESQSLRTALGGAPARWRGRGWAEGWPGPDSQRYSPGPGPLGRRVAGTAGVVGASAGSMLGGRRASSDPGRAGLLGGNPCSLVWGLRQGLWVPTVPGERGSCATPDGRSHLQPAGWEHHPCLSLPGPSPLRRVSEWALRPLGPLGGQAPSPDADGHFVDGTENRRFKQTRQGPLLSAGEKAGSAHTLDTCLQGTISWGRQ